MAVLSLAWMLSGAVMAQSASESSGQSSVSAKVQSGQLSLDSQAAPLASVLTELGRVSGVRVYVEGGLETDLAKDAVTIKLDEVSVEEGLRRLLAGRNCIFVYAAEGLIEARIYGQGTGAFKRLGADAPSVASNDKGDRAEIQRLKQEALSNPSGGERVKALEKLSDVADEAFVKETAVAVLQRDGEPDVLESAMDMLDQQESPPIEPVLDLLRRINDESIRIKALDFLAEHGGNDPRVREVANWLARTDRRSDVRDSARNLLGSLDQE